jgi:ABC-2 type transport system ATP-binding protein/transposase
MIPEDDEIRLLDALLRELDWSRWENLYERRRGQPPIHPRFVAGALLFCLGRGVLSSRGIEEATRRRIDLIWFLEGRTIDHSTLCAFRKKFAELLPALFDELARKAARAPQAGRRLAVDGTRMRANSDRHGSRTAASLRRRLGEMAENREALFAEMERLDALEDNDGAPGEQDEKALRKQIEALEAQRRKLHRALERAEERDALKQAKDGANATAVRVPTSDPDAHLLPNKEGGYAPNYTPTIAVDVASGAIVDAQVPDGAEEAGTLDEVLEASERRLGRKPETLLCDGNFATGAALKKLEQAHVTMCSPASASLAPAARREDPRQPVDASLVSDLPTTGRGENKRFAREAFVYDENEDCYYCPAGRRLLPAREEKRREKNGSICLRWRYRSPSCSECPLSKRCLKGQAKVRSVVRDEYQPVRDRLAAHMERDDSRQLYKKRAPTVEGAFGHIKHVMGVRRFLRRGRAAVRNEWLWICTAFNVGKILRRPPQPGPNGPTNRPDPSSKAVRDRKSAFPNALFAPIRRLALFARLAALICVFKPALAAKHTECDQM